MSQLREALDKQETLNNRILDLTEAIGEFRLREKDLEALIKSEEDYKRKLREQEKVAVQLQAA